MSALPLARGTEVHVAAAHTQLRDRRPAGGAGLRLHVGPHGGRVAAWVSVQVSELVLALEAEALAKHPLDRVVEAALLLRRQRGGPSLGVEVGPVEDVLKRAIAQAHDQEAAFAIPGCRLEEIAKGLKKSHEAGMRYPTPSYLKFSPVLTEFAQGINELTEYLRQGRE